MIYFISPAFGFKSFDKAQHSTDDIQNTQPQFMEVTREIIEKLSSMDVLEIQHVLGCSDILAELNFERYQDFWRLKQSQALKLFDGIAYKALDVETLNSSEYNFLVKHLRILSGLYGVLRPTDLISPYRLEMKTKLNIEGKKNLYNLWSDKIYQSIRKDADGIIVNIASKEYSQCIDKYIQDETYITCTFKVDKGNGLKVQATAAKQARGHMVRWIAQNKIKSPEDLIQFDVDGYEFAPDLSQTSGQIQEFIFVKYSD